MKASLLLRTSPFAVSLLLFVLGSILGNYDDDGIYGFALYWVALVILFFGIVLDVKLSLPRSYQLPRSILGSAVLAVGASFVFFYGLALPFNESAYAARCYNIDCGPFLQLYFWDFATPIVGGLLLVFIGIWLLAKQKERVVSKEVIEAQ